MSADLYWMIIRDNNAYLSKKRDVKKPFSTEPGNLKNVASFRYNGLVHPKTVDIQPAKDNKGFVVTTKKPKKQNKSGKSTLAVTMTAPTPGALCINFNKPGKSTIAVTMTAGPRRSLYKLRKYLEGSNYRRDLIQVALRRASAILESQKRSAIIAKKSSSKKSE